jgi:pimeloyl-ACP methyl ester carboxylesterase
MTKSRRAWAGVFLVLIVTGFACRGERGPDPGSRNPDDLGWVDRAVDVGGHDLHLRCRGTGSPAIVLDTGLGETYRTWEPVIEELARELHVCVYDRAGYGESDAGPFPRSSERVAGELASLLIAADEARSHVLVGHSLGGVHTLIVADTHPELVSGVVAIDPPPPEFVAGNAFPGLAQMAEQQTLELRRQAQQQRDDGQAGYAAYFDSVASEHEMLLSGSAERYTGLKSLGEIPLIVIGAGLPNPALGDVADEFQSFWVRSNRGLATLSRNGSFVLARDSGHHVHLDSPQIVVDAVRRLAATNADGGGR